MYARGAISVLMQKHSLNKALVNFSSPHKNVHFQQFQWLQKQYRNNRCFILTLNNLNKAGLSKFA